jgi:hypothetical protein
MRDGKKGRLENQLYANLKLGFMPKKKMIWGNVLHISFVYTINKQTWRIRCFDGEVSFAIGQKQ